MDDDDEFIVPDDVDEEIDDDMPPSSSRAPSRSSRASSRSRLSEYAMGSSSEPDIDAVESDDDIPRKKAPQKKSVSEKHDGPQGGSGSLFLTKAELRTQKQKDEKKSSDAPFSFLVNIRDKDGVRPDEPGYDPRTLYVPPKAWNVFTPFEKQVRTLPFYGLLTDAYFCSSGKSNKTTLIQYCSSRKESFWNSMRTMPGSGTRNSI